MAKILKLNWVKFYVILIRFRKTFKKLKTYLKKN